ncbi:MAG: ASPIC/UnbV domain-containing protein, partial [Planctomycetes bacterium]|nr:ASPIC/UnbV domain-containing protein [Planctomycetota bacterium]
VTVRFGENQLVQEMAGGTSYAASHERVLFLGLGGWTGTCQIEVRWPSGAVDTVEGAAGGPLLTVLEGRGLFQTNYELPD